MIITLAGRRIDAHDALTPRFPLEKRASVSTHLLNLLKDQQATALVSSAACGADLLALEAAGHRGIQRHVVLPFSRERFRTISVTDRPGEWGALFDQVIREIEAAGNLVLLNERKEDTAAFLRTNRAILNEAQTLASQTSPGKAASLSQNLLAVIVWDGLSRGEDDLTADFANEARSRGISVREIKTL